MKTRESRLQNGIFVYKRGISLTKQESHLQNGIHGVQTGLSGCYLPSNIDISVGVGYNDITNNLQAHIICIRI